MTMIRMLVATVTASLAATVSHNITLQQYLTTRFVTVSHNIALQQYLTTRFVTVSHNIALQQYLTGTKWQNLTTISQDTSVLHTIVVK